MQVKFFAAYAAYIKLIFLDWVLCSSSRSWILVWAILSLLCEVKVSLDFCRRLATKSSRRCTTNFDVDCTYLLLNF